MRGRLGIWQPREGYRFTVDALLLADFAAEEAAEEKGAIARACELGAGSGVVALALALRLPTTQIVAVELQPRLAALARRNVAENGLSARLTIVELDLGDRAATRRLLAGASFDLVLTNPPYWPVGQGTLSPCGEEAIARHELRLRLDQLLAEARRLLVAGGKVALIYPAERLTPLLAGLETERLWPERLRFVYTRPGEPARRVLVAAKKGGRGALVVEPPLYLYDSDGNYSKEARRALGEV